MKDVVACHLEKTAEEVIVPAFVNNTATSSPTDAGASGSADAGAAFLKTVKRVWDDYTTAMDMIQKILYYLVRKDLPVFPKGLQTHKQKQDDKLPKYELPHVTDMGLDLFRDKVIRSDKYPIQTQLISAMLNQIQLERHGEVIDRTAIKAAVQMLCALVDPPSKETVYAVDFESKYLETSTVFYQIESQVLSSSYDAPQFMQKVSTESGQQGCTCLILGLGR